MQKPYRLVCGTLKQLAVYVKANDVDVHNEEQGMKILSDLPSKFEHFRVATHATSATLVLDRCQQMERHKRPCFACSMHDMGQIRMRKI